MSDSEIIQLASGRSSTASSDEEEGEEEEAAGVVDCQPAHVSHTDAAAAVDVLLRYFKQSDQATQDDIQPLCAIKCRVDALTVAAQKQSSILDYFHRRI